MYIIMELARQQKAFDNILQVIEKIKKSTFKKRTILSNVALSLLKKDLSPLALSLDQYGVSYLPKSSNNSNANWYQSIRRGKHRLFKVLKLNKDKLTTVIKINMNTKSQVQKQHRVSIGCVHSAQKLKQLRKEHNNYPDISRQKNDNLNYLSSNLSSAELIGMPINQLYRIAIPKLRYQYRKTTLQEEDLLQMREARQLLIQLIDNEEVSPTTRATKKGNSIQINII